MSKLLAIPNVDFKSIEQKHALLTILNMQSQINGLCALETNGGKSMLYIIPHAFFPRTVVIVILPLKALLYGNIF
jgi:superfamily II DNA helicase RecQ